MDKRLNDILTYYKEEKSKLLQLIETYISDEEYFNAHTISKEIFNIDQKLQRFYILNDELNDEKIKLESVNTPENLINPEISDYIQDNYARLIDIHHEQLRKLRLLKPIEDQNGNKNVLDKVLSMLMSRKIRKFKIIFDKSANFYCELKVIKHSIVITIPQIRGLLKLFWFDDYKMNQLVRLGFEFSKKANKLNIIAPYESSDDLYSTKTLLSRIVFEVFNHGQFENQSFIEY